MTRRRWSAQQMRELLREHERSGMSLTAFATAAKVPHSTLAWWRARLRSESELARFVPVSVDERTSSAVEIVVADVLVRVVDGDERAVARLVRAIASC